MIRPTSEEQLLAAVLRRATATSTVAQSIHPDEETLALFAEWQLPNRERSTVIEHLAECDACRQLMVAVWELGEEDFEDHSSKPHHEADEDHSKPTIQPTATPATPLSSSRYAWSTLFTVAAMMLIAVGMWWQGPRVQLAERRAYQRSQQLLASADFDQAALVLYQARQQGIRSDRLLSLNSQAVRQLSGTLALASAGTLTDFGFDFDGTLARGPNEQVGLRDAAQLFAEARTEPLELLLNRGHLGLTQNNLEAALTDFRRATQTAPREPLAWLGLGLVEFSREHFEAAELAFRRCLDLAPDQLSAHINLAMTLEELGRIDDARTEWRSIITRSLSDSVRLKILHHLKTLND